MFRRITPQFSMAKYTLGARAEIVEVSLPEELESGLWITGYVKVRNNGTSSGKIGSIIHTLWDDQYYGAYETIPQGGLIKFVIPDNLIKMPDKDANIEIMAGVLLDGWESFRIDDTTSWTVKKKLPLPPIPTLPWWIWAGIAIAAGLGIAIYLEQRRREELLLLLGRR